VREPKVERAALKTEGIRGRTFATLAELEGALTIYIRS